MIPCTPRTILRFGMFREAVYEKCGFQPRWLTLETYKCLVPIPLRKEGMVTAKGNQTLLPDWNRETSNPPVSRGYLGLPPLPSGPLFLPIHSPSHLRTMSMSSRYYYRTHPMKVSWDIGQSS